MNDDVGVLAYLSPETIAKKYTEKADIWTVGAIMFHLLCGEPLFIGLNFEFYFLDESPE